MLKWLSVLYFVFCIGFAGMVISSSITRKYSDASLAPRLQHAHTMRLYVSVDIYSIRDTTLSQSVCIMQFTRNFGFRRF